MTQDYNPYRTLALESPSELFHEASKLRESDSAIGRAVWSVNTSPVIRQVISKPATSYFGYPLLHLPREHSRPDRPLAEVLLGRRSARVYTTESVELAELSALLYYSVAVTSTNTDSNGIVWGQRCAPSGGSLYPIDVYCISQKVVGCNEGLYSYDPNAHGLQILAPGSHVDRISSATFLGETVAKAAVVILMTANFPRTKFKYGERAYRFTLLEAGHIAQNMLLVAESLGLGALPVGGYVDDQLNAIIGADGCEQTVVYAVIIGRLPKESTAQKT